MVIRINTFGGLVPKASARALPDNAAQVAQDLQADSAEFRPVATDVQVLADSGVTNPKTIYRLQRKADGTLNTDFTSAATWKVSAIEKSFVRGQLNNDLTERTYVTLNDGSGAPRVIDATGQDRQLGVPSPVTAPTVTVNVVDEFTTDERSASLAAIESDLKSAAAAIVTPVWRGASATDPATYRPGGTHPGYADRVYVPGVDPQEAQEIRLFRTTSTAGAKNGTISDDYTGGSKQGWPFDSSLGGFWVPASSSWPGFITWPGSTYDHWAIPFSAYGLTYDINDSGLNAALTAIDMPGGTVGEKLLTSDQVTEIVGKVDDMSTQQWADVAPKLNALYAKVQQVKILLDGGAQGSLVAANTAYYATTAISDILTNGVANAAEAIWNEALKAANFVEFAPPGG